MLSTNDGPQEIPIEGWTTLYARTLTRTRELSEFNR